MTAVLEKPALLGSCPKIWCLGANGCAECSPGDAVWHEGRTSSVPGAFGGELEVTPELCANDDGSTCGVPLVTIRLDLGRRDVPVSLTVEQALTFSAALARFIDDETSVGERETFEGVEVDGEPNGSTLTLTRLSGAVFEYGNGAPRYGTLGDVQVSVSSPGSSKADKIGLTGPDATFLARSIAVSALEVTR